MFSILDNVNPILAAFIATMFTFSVTAIGAAIVFLFKKVNNTLMDAMLGFAAGVMIAASYFSLLNPAIEMANNLNMIPYIVTTIGFLAGGVLLFIGDKVFTVIDKKMAKNSNKSIKRSLMLIISITLHNIPEGLAVGVSFGSIIYALNGSTIESASLLALGIGLQNFPEGTAVSVPLRREGFSRGKAFMYGSLSGIVEPIAGVLGAILVLKVRMLLSFLLSFAAGAMIYVVIEELIPESQTNEKKDLMAFFTLIGFSVMMILDIALG